MPRSTPGVSVGKPRRNRHRRSLARRLSVALLVIVFATVTAVLSGSIWLEASLRPVTALADYPGRPGPGSGTNWLLVGSDGRGDLTEEQQADLSTGGDLGSSRTDTILLVHIPRLLSGVPTVVVSIPRDSYVDVPGWGSDKVNAAYAAGGAPLLVQTVEQATGLRIDHYAEVGFAGFGAVVDALGGVEICLPEPLTDPLAGVDLPAGCQTVPGRDALGYVRSRDTPRADLDRMVHQREFMAALLKRVTAPAVWLNPWRWYVVPKAVVAALGVDQGTHSWDLVRLAWALHGTVTTLTVPIGEFTATDSGAAVVWDSGAADALFSALRTDSVVPQQVFDAQP